MRCGSRPVGPDPHVCLRPGTVKIRESGTASNYGSGIKERTRISRRTGTRPDFVFLAGTVVWSKLLKSLLFKHTVNNLPPLVRIRGSATDGGSTEIDGISPGQIRGWSLDPVPDCVTANWVRDLNT
jgi:hypothetical protein